MGCGKKAKVKPTIALSSDRISSLPEEIKAKILSNLSTDEAVRTSVLSSASRNVWTISPDIFLDDCKFYTCNACSASGFSGRAKFVTLVDMALSFHKGPLDSFTIQGEGSYHDVFTRWMYMLSTKGLGDVIIKLTSGVYYKIPSSLFSISQLYFLYLKNCSFSLPKSFKGFKLLKVLKLKVFSSTDSDISNLISSCPLLNVVRLKYFEGITCLNIQAQALQILEIEGNFGDLCVNAPNLVHVYLTLDNIEALQSVPVKSDRKSYLKQSFGSLTRIETLTVTGSFLTYLSKGCMLTKLPGVFDHLQKFYIERCLWNWSESDPCPEASTRTGIWDQDHTMIQPPALDHLVMITLNDFMGLECEVAFLGLLLGWAPA